MRLNSVELLTGQARASRNLSSIIPIAWASVTLESRGFANAD